MFAEIKAHPFIVFFIAASSVLGMVLAWALLPEEFSFTRRLVSGAIGGAIFSVIPVLNRFMGALDGDDTWDGEKRAELSINSNQNSPPKEPISKS